jgi:hypothetical protein
MPYQTPSYGGQSSGYETGQETSWNNDSSYGGTRETTSRAAEVLRNMSNTGYAPNSTGASAPNFTAANTAAPQNARYPAGSSHSPQLQPQQTHATQPAFPQAQDRPRSVSTNRMQQTPARGHPSPATATGYPAQRAQTIHNQQLHQRSASPAQHQYTNNAAVPPSSAGSAAMTPAATQQYTDCDRRQLASVEASRSTPSTSYTYNAAPSLAPSGPNLPHTSSIPQTYTSQSSGTVDPTAVYDPWPEYERKRDALLAQKAAEDAARVEEERVRGEARKVAEAHREEVRKRQEALLAVSQPKQTANKVQHQPQESVQAISAGSEVPANAADALETEIRAMMAKMRELNGKDPALLARIWEEERRAKAAPKSSTVQKSATAQAGAVVSQGVPVQANVPQVANQRKKAAPKEPTSNSATSATPLSAVPIRQPVQIPSARHSGNTIWPPEKKAHLASAATFYLNIQNPNNHVDATGILSMLDGNPSYIELCEQLERMGLKLDRAVFAKSLLTAVPDVNSSARKVATQPLPVRRAQVPPATMKKETATPAAASPSHTPAAASPADTSSYPPFPDNASPATNPAPVAEMVPIEPELKLPANKEEAARKRDLSDLVDLTQLSEDEDEDMGPPAKRHDTGSTYNHNSPHNHAEDFMVVDSEPAINNFPIANALSRAVPVQATQQALVPDRELRHRIVVKPLDKKNALRRNTYNPATIARDVLLACGRHPSERQLNQHLDVLRSNLPLIGFESDLSTVMWDIIDPGNPPPGYFKDSVQALTEDADDEDDEEDEDRAGHPRAQSNAIGAESGAHIMVRALPEAINPFSKQKKRGRPARQSLPNSTALSTPKRSPSVTEMSASAPRPSAASVGYSAFRSATEYGPDGTPLPKKRGRPVGWRKAIHGSPAAQATPNVNGHTKSSTNHQPAQPSSLRNVKTGGHEPIRIDSRSPSVVNRNPRFQSYKCKWLKCTAALHNLETLKKHVYKVHRKETLRNTLECLWGDCGNEGVKSDPNTNMRLEKHTPHSFDLESNWRSHIQHTHFDPLSWEFGDGPASGLSGNEN